MLYRDIKPYIPLAFDENKKCPENQDSKLIEEVIKKGYDEGLNKGYNEGFQRGYEEGLNRSQHEIKEKSDEFLRAAEIFKDLIKELTEFKEKQIESFFPQILKLSFQIAEKIVATKISLDKEVILSVVKEALKAIPLNEEQIIIKLNPDDYNFISEKIEELEIDKTRIQIEPSIEITKGGCLIETQSMHIVSTIEQRFKEIEDAVSSVISK